MLFGSMCTKLLKHCIIKYSLVRFSYMLTGSEVYQAFTPIIDSYFIALSLLKIPNDDINVKTFSQDCCNEAE